MLISGTASATLDGDAITVCFDPWGSQDCPTTTELGNPNAVVSNATVEIQGSQGRNADILNDTIQIDYAAGVLSGSPDQFYFGDLDWSGSGEITGLAQVGAASLDVISATFGPHWISIVTLPLVLGDPGRVTFQISGSVPEPGLPLLLGVSAVVVAVLRRPLV